MSAVRAASISMSLTERAIAQLLARHGDTVSLADLPWLGACISQVREGRPLREGQIARISRIRAEYGHRFQQVGGHDENGAA